METSASVKCADVPFLVLQMTISYKFKLTLLYRPSTKPASFLPVPSSVTTTSDQRAYHAAICALVTVIHRPLYAPLQDLAVITHLSNREAFVIYLLCFIK